MTTKNSRLNITLDPKTNQLLVFLANQSHKSVSSIAGELLREAIEQHEDAALSTLAAQRDIKEAERVSHDQAWGA